MKITNDIKYIGVNDRSIDLFEGQYKVPNGISYNSYAIIDEKIAALEKQYGKLPAFKSNTGAVVIVNGKVTLVETREELWRAVATPEALKAGINTVWYVGENFVGTWDGKNFDVKINE